MISDSVKAQLSSFTDTRQPSSVQRLAGGNRYETNVAVVKRFWPTTAARTVVVSGLNFPDALAHGPYARPVHLARATSIDAVVANDIRRLDPSLIEVFGGTVIGDPVIDQLRGLLP